MKFAILCLAPLCIPVSGQITDPIAPVTPLSQLSAYLQLTGEQTLILARLNADWNQYLAQKYNRISQVNRELDDVARQDTIDPMAFGVRYAEIESICREAKDRMSQNQQKTRAVLNDAQKQKLQVLEQAFALAPAIMQAQQVNMMGREVKLANPKPILGSGTAQYWITPNYLESLPGCRVSPPTLYGILVPADRDPN